MKVARKRHHQFPIQTQKLSKIAGDLVVVKKYISGNLDISHSQLTSLEGCSEIIYGNFFCSGNRLTSLEYAPKKILGDFRCENNFIFSSFEYFPTHIGGNCMFHCLGINSFKDIDQHIKFIGNKLTVFGANITSGYSDLFGIDGLQKLLVTNTNYEIEIFACKYLPTKDLIEFQDEMIKAGYESYL